MKLFCFWIGRRISIHALRAEGDLSSTCFCPGCWPFLSTPSVRRATLCFLLLHRAAEISIHALRAEGDDGGIVDNMYPAISIHALRAEGDFLRSDFCF